MRVALGILVGIIIFNVLVVLAFMAYAIPKRRRLERGTLGRMGAGAPARSRSGRLIATGLIATIVIGGTALATPSGRDAVVSVIATVAEGLELTSDDDEGAAATSPETSAPRSTQGAGTSGRPERSSGPQADRLPDSQGSTHSPGGSPGTPGSGVPGSPMAPATVTATAGSSSSITVRWSDVSSATGFRLERSIEGSSGWNTIIATGQHETEIVDAGLLPGTTYFYRIFTTSLGGESPPTATISATTGVDPASPTTVEATAWSSSSIVLDWQDVASETGFRLERSLEGSEWITIATTGQDVTTFLDTGLDAGTTYQYRIFAVNAGGDSEASGIAMATTTADPALPSP